MNENQYSESASLWYDRIMKAGYYDHNSIADALDNILENRKKILELGVGTGLLAEQMINRGYEVSGIDFTPTMLEIAKKRIGGKAKLYEQNVIDLNLPETYEAAVSEGGVWPVTRDEEGRIFLDSHITNIEQNILALKKVANHLDTKGLLVLGIQSEHKDFDGLRLEGDAIYSQKVRYILPFIEKEYFVKQNGQNVAYQQCKYRRFTKDEQERIMRLAGFSEIGIDDSNQFLIYKKAK